MPLLAQTPKTIPVVFHNGGGYDFHFLLRYIATMGSPVCRAPREELGKDSDNEGTESKAEGDQEGSGSESETHAHGPGRASGPGQGQGQGQECLDPLRFVDSNVFPTSLGHHDRQPQGLHPQAAARALR